MNISNLLSEACQRYPNERKRKVDSKSNIYKLFKEEVMESIEEQINKKI